MSDGEGRDRDIREDVVLARELADVVREVGPTVADDPRRVQGLLSDILGEASRTRRAEIDAIVSAADESIPADLVASRVDRSGAIERMRDRGFADAAACFSVDAWRYALGLSEPGQAPPVLAVDQHLVTTATVTALVPEATMRIPHEEIITVRATPLATDPAHDPSPLRPSGGRRRRLRVALPIAAVVVVVSATVIAVASGGGSGPSAASSTTEASPTVTFPVESTSLGNLTRTWTVQNGELEASLMFQNTTDADATDRYYEVIPKDLTASAENITAVPPATVVENDPVLAWDLEVPADGSYEVLYRIEVGAVAQSDLDRWQRLQVTAANAFVAVRETIPTLVVNTPDGTVVTSPEADVSGTADVTATVTVNEVAAPVNPDGTWSAHIPLAVGANVVTVIATSPYGTSTTSTLTITFQPPRVTTTTARRPPTSTTSTTPPSTTTPPGTTTTVPGSTTSTVSIPSTSSTLPASTTPTTNAG